MPTHAFRAATLLVVLAAASVSQAAPLAPDELRVSDTASWVGQSVPATGVSPHPYFSMVYRSGGPVRPAVKARIQIAPEPGFTEMTWDSGFVEIAPTAPNQRTPNISYLGPPLMAGQVYFLRCGTQDDQGASSPWSIEVPGGGPLSFALQSVTGACDARVQTNAGNSQQGNPALLPSAGVSFSAEFVGALAPAQLAQVQVSLTDDFESLYWDSGWVSIASVTPGQRCNPISAVVSYSIEVAYFWRIRFRDDEEMTSAWNEAGASFIVPLQVSGQPAPAGFAHTKRDFGLLGAATSDIVVSDLNGDGVEDALVVAAAPGESHAVHYSFGATTPGQVVYFGSAGEGPSRGACLDYDMDGDKDIAVACGAEVVLYANSGGQFFASFPLEYEYEGGLISLTAGDLNWDGYPDLIVAYTDKVVWYPHSGEWISVNWFLEGVLVAQAGSLILDVELGFYAQPEGGKGGTTAALYVLYEGTLEAYAARRSFAYDLASWEFPNATKFALASNGEPPNQIVCTNGVVLELRELQSSNQGGFWQTLAQLPLEHSGQCAEILLGNLDNAGATDALLLLDTGALICLYGPEGFAEHELVGYGQEGAYERGAICDADGDAHLDVAVIRPGATNQVYFNRPRRSVSIADANTVQPAYGEGYIEFEVALNALPVSLIEVDCATIEEEGGGEEEGDGIADATAGLLAGPLPYVPTSTRIYFVPGQLTARFRVNLTKAAIAGSFAFQVRIVSSRGALISQAIATGTIYAPGSGSSGPPATSGMQRDWTLRGHVNAVTQLGNGNTYFGGEFDGVEWSAGCAAVLDSFGTRMRPMPDLSGAGFSLKAAAMDTDGSVYLGGKFSFTLQGQLFKNIVKVRSDGSVDTAFHPNPDTGTGDGVVNAIALKSGSVYFGGKFTKLANTSLVFKNIAHVLNTGAYAQIPNRFGVYHVPVWGETTPPPPEVLALLVANSGFVGSDYLLVGGRNFDHALCGSSQTAVNLAAFKLSGVTVPNMPRVFGEVRALAVSNEVFSNMGAGGYSRTILFGGNFELVCFPKELGMPLESRPNLNSTNFTGELEWGKSPSAMSLPAVNALLVESGNRLWVGRNNQGYGLSADPLAYFTVSQGNFTLSTSFSSGLNMPVRGLALGDNEVLVVGDFDKRTTPTGQVDVGRALLFSTLSLGEVSQFFRSSFDSYIVAAAPGRDAQDRLRGFVVCGAFKKLIARRGNLAAMNAVGELLPWGPSVDGPIHTLATDGTDIYFGGNFTAATGTQVFNRRSLASAPANDDAIDVNNWLADVSGSACDVRALAFEGTSLILGGDFTSINGIAREDAAAVVDTAASLPGAAGVLPWNPNLAPDASSKVFALVRDGGVVYLGGSFSGTAGVARPALLAVTAPSGGPTTLLSWDPAIAAPCTVRAVGVSANDVYFLGQFNSVGGASRANIAAVSKSTAAPTPFAPVVAGNLHALAALPSGVVYVSGESLTFTVGGNPVSRRGVAALDAAGNLLGWEAQVLGTGTSELVRTLMLDDTQAIGRLWVGGRFSGMPHIGQHDLTWFTRAWNITTPSLPDANENQPYGPLQISLSEPAACTWSINAPVAWLQIDANGCISGNCPIGGLAHFPVEVVAIQAGSPPIVTSKWFLLTVIPVPPPTELSIQGPGVVIEGPGPLIDPAPIVTIWLNQLFAADVTIELQYVDDTAFDGLDYASQVRQAKILAGHWSVDVPLCIFGDSVVNSAPNRMFRVRIVSQTQGVIVRPWFGEWMVNIQDDDPPVPQHAIVHGFQIRESVDQAALSSHVVSNQPWFKWSFRSDFIGDAQTGWQVQVFTNAAFAGTPLWDSGSQAGADTEIQLGSVGGSATLSDGQNYYARVRLWSSPTEVSDWHTLDFRTNTPPPAVSVSSMSPSGTVSTSRPTLTWTISPDAEGDPLQFKVTLTGPNTLELDSRLHPWIFERFNAASSSWEPFGQAGVGADITMVRVTIPMGSALSTGQWNWTVLASDGFETTPASPPPGVVTIDIQPAYTASGRVLDASGVADANRYVSVYLMPNHTLLGSNITNANGEFFIPLGNLAQPGNILAVLIDNPASPPPGYNPAYAAAFLRFSGNDLVQVSGPDRGIELFHGRVSVDPRGMDSFTLASLLDGGSGDLDWPFTLSADQLVLRMEMSTLDIEGVLAVLGTGASPGEPTALVLPGTVLGAQELKIHAHGALCLQEAAVVDVSTLSNDGCLSLESGSTLRLHGPSTSSGQFEMQSAAVLELHVAQLVITDGYPHWQDAQVRGMGGTDEVLVQGGALSASGTTFDGVTLDVGPEGDLTELSGAVFTGPAVDHRIGWNRQRGIDATLRGIRFDTGSPYNVGAIAGADKLNLSGCGGDLSGEGADLDPGESTGQDIVTWALASLQDCRAVAGDTRVLLLWQAGVQTGSAFNYNIYVTDVPGGQVTLVSSTMSSFFVDSNLINGTIRYYYIELLAWGTHSVWSVEIPCTPLPPALESAFPVTLRETGTAPGIAQGTTTHFKSSSGVSSPQAGVSIPSASIDVISENLILFDVETSAAALGMVTLEITTPDVWAEHGAPSYAEIVSFQAEVKPPATPNYPSVVFVQTSGAVGPDALTNGAFDVAVEFNQEGGAEIEPQSFECVVDRDIMVAGQIVPAGTNLASPQYGLWGTPTATGASWHVDQVQVTTDPQEEFISRGELIISVRVANAFGYRTPWRPMRIHVQGGDPDYAIMAGLIEPGLSAQPVEVRAVSLTPSTTYAVEFLPQGCGITAPNAGTQSSGALHLALAVTAADDISMGSGAFTVTNVSTQQVVAEGTYRTGYKYAGLYSAPSSGAGPRAATAAVGVTLQNGEFTWSETDLTTKARKFPIVWSRNYRSSHAERRDTPLGKGWYGPYFQKVEVVNDMLRWVSPDGDIVDFENPQQVAVNKYEWKCPPGYNVVAKTPVDSAVSVEECDITTSEGLTYRFRLRSAIEFALNPPPRTLLLGEIVDSNLNRQVLEYDGNDKRVTTVRGDTYDEGVAECLRLTYYDTGMELLKTVTRVRSVRNQADSAPLDTIRYYYTSGGRLALQRIPDGDRFSERSYKGYSYDQGFLKKIFAPSRTVTSPTQINPASDDSDTEWNCFAVASGSPAPVPALTIAYDQSTGRVESQILGPTGGAAERRYTITYGSGGASNERIVTPPSGSACKLEYMLNDDGQATSVTQYVPAFSGPGSTGFTTTYEYEAYTQNLLKITQPRMNCTYFNYAPGAIKSNGSGIFTAMGVPLGGNTTELALQLGYTTDPSWVGCVAKILQINPTGLRERFYVVDQATAGSTLVLGANLIADGFMPTFPGTFEIYDANGNPLSRSLVIQERRCEGSGWTSSDLVTTYVRSDDKRNGNYYSNLTETIDPWGRRTTIKHTYSQDFLAPDKRSVETCETSCNVATAMDAQNDNAAKELILSFNQYDKFGRLAYARGPQRKPAQGEEDKEFAGVSYLYFTIGQSVTPIQGTYPGQLFYADSSRSGTEEHGPKYSLTRYTYDARGHVNKVKLPRAASPAPYTAADFESTVVTNSAGQVIHVTGPGNGPVGSCRTSETWYFYDKDGRLVHQCVKFVPVDQADVTQFGDGSEQDESAIISAFPRPPLITFGNEKYIGAGWVHTRYEYDAWGDLTKEIQDFDYDASGQLMVAETCYEYDLEGRCKVVKDPLMHITRSVYEPRGLRSVTFADGTGSESAMEYQYDGNGNLTGELIGEAAGSTVLTTAHQYDGFNRRTQTAHFHGSGGVWSELVEYPKPAGPIETGTFLAIGWGSSPAKKRGSKSLEDGAGRAYRNWTIAQNKSGGELKGAIKLAGAVGVEGLHWAVSASELDARGMPVHTWVRLENGWMPRVEHNIFDGHGTLVHAFGPSTSKDGIHASFFYDAAGNTVKTITPVAGPDQLIASSIALVEYDPANQPTKTMLKWKGGLPTSTEEDVNSNTSIARNNLGWPERSLDGANRETRCDYNFVGLVRRRTVVGDTGAIKGITCYEYYLDGTVKTETAYRADIGAATAGTAQVTSYEYDAKGRVTQIVRPGNMRWTYTYKLLDQPLEETRPDGTLIKNKYDFVGNLTERTITSPSGNAKENYAYGPFDEVAEATTSNGAGKLTSKLQMEYNSLGQVERQVLTVYDDQGNALSPYFVEHNWPEGSLGFKSLYESATLGFSSFEMISEYDCLGREIGQEYWDDRKVKSQWHAVLPLCTIDNTNDKNEIPLVTYLSHQHSLLYGRKAHERVYLNVYHVRSMRPSQPGRKVMFPDDIMSATTCFGFGPQGGLADVKHIQDKFNPNATVTHEDFAHVQTRYDGAGNPVLERSVHRGGLSRVMKYDHSTRLQKSFQGHLVLNTPGLILDPGDGNLNPAAAQWERTYTQDTLDNITEISDVIGADVTSRKTSTVSMPVKSNTENVIKSIGQSGEFDYDNCKSLEADPTTGLTYKYNYRGQVIEVESGGTSVRRCVYDCFGRMVLQLEAPGGAAERGTIFIPNVGFGGGGEGADYAAEITFERDGSVVRGREVVQYTYGTGAIGGGLGRKRLVEFVAYCSEFAPYFRFLHEDAQGNTIATTSLWGDRLDEYDYTDYGVPLHAPVALDGRWITDVTASTTTDVSIVDLSSSNLLVPNELIGCELRVALSDAGAANAVFLAGTVISHRGSQIAIDDPGHAIATAWNQTGQGQAHRPSACFYDLREGCYRGVVDTVTPGNYWFDGVNRPCRFITVVDGPFETWMISYTGAGPKVFARFGGEDLMVIGADTPADPTFTSGGFKRLIVDATGFTGTINPGDWYIIKGNCSTEDICRTGTWATAPGYAGDLTTFVLEGFVELRNEQLGWWLQPDINCQAFFPIVAISKANHTVTVAGDQRGLGQQGKRFRIFAPPGTQTRGVHAGLLPMFAEAASSRYLYRGYRYETPASGRWDDIAKGIAARQGGKNFTGQHYTLFRHFDPGLMRFTSLDPLASSQNLWAYCENNPHGSYDPDGLLMLVGMDNRDWDWELFAPAAGKFFENVWNAVAFVPKNGISGTWDTLRVGGNLLIGDTEAAGKVWNEYWHERTALFRSDDRQKMVDSVTEKFDPSYYKRELDESVRLYGNGRKTEAAQKFGHLSFDAINTATMVYGSARVAMSLTRAGLRAGGNLLSRIPPTRLPWNYTFQPTASLGGFPLPFGKLRYVGPKYPRGSFSIIKWEGYPSAGGVPQPKGPFRLLKGAEYDAALAKKNAANAALHRANPSFDGLEIHEIHPVKFGGSPTDLANKIVLKPGTHHQFSSWWYKLQRKLGG